MATRAASGPDGLSGKTVLSNQVTFDDLKDLIVNDYRNNGRKSLGHLGQVRLPRLPDVFAFTPTCGFDFHLTRPKRG